MDSFKMIAVMTALAGLSVAHAKNAHQEFDVNAQQALTQYYQQYKDLEYFSGASLSIYVPKHDIQNYYIGQISRAAESAKISADTLFQIGSITKSFTAAILLQLEKENKLSLDDTVKKWLPDYDKWSAVNMTALLNMTSGLPNYSDAPLWIVKEYNDPQHVWSNSELIEYVYPKENFSPPLKGGYYYTNTGYILADLIVEKAAHETFQHEMIDRMIKPANLTHTFYPVPTGVQEIKNRMAHGYNYNQYDVAPLVGKDVTNHDISWAAAAGGVVSTSEDVIKWVKALFVDDTILDAKQKKKLMQMISLATGKPITKISESEPHGFGLGVTQMYLPAVGRFWFYEGETLGFRALYMYIPCNGVIVSSIFNSATNSENDHTKELMMKTYKLIMDQYPQLHC
jgi:D-alanyl-D-alanine carboxypeptidase